MARGCAASIKIVISNFVRPFLRRKHFRVVECQLLAPDGVGGAGFHLPRYRTATRQPDPASTPRTPLPGQLHGADRRIGPRIGNASGSQSDPDHGADRTLDQGRNRPEETPEDRRLKEKPFHRRRPQPIFRSGTYASAGRGKPPAGILLDY